MPETSQQDPKVVQAIRNECYKLADILIKKNHDYGSSAFQSPLLNPVLSPREAIEVRMSDKIARMNQLSTDDPEVAESREDTVRDLAGYCILWLLASGESWT